MFNLTLRTIKNRKLSILAYLLGSLAFLEMYIAMFPSIKEQAAKMAELFSSYPESFLKVFGLDKNTLIFDTLEKFLSVEYFSIIFPVILFAMMIGWGGSALAGEIEKGTMGFLLSKPLTRTKIFSAKYLSGAAALATLTIFAVYGAAFLANIHNVPYHADSYSALAALSFLLGLATLSVSFFFSALLSDKNKAHFATIAVIILMYVFDIISKLKDNLANLKYASFFYYYDYQGALLNSNLKAESVWVFLAVSALFVLLALAVFNRRDLNV